MAHGRNANVDYRIRCGCCKREVLVTAPHLPKAEDGIEINGVYASAEVWKKVFKKILG